MRTRRFHAPTLAEAQEMVRAALGDDAVIVSTRKAETTGRFGVGKRAVVEVTAGLPEGEARTPLRAVKGGTATATALAEPPAETQEDEGGHLAPPFLNVLAGAARGGPFDVYNRVAASTGGNGNGAAKAAKEPEISIKPKAAMASSTNGKTAQPRTEDGAHGKPVNGKAPATDGKTAGSAAPTNGKTAPPASNGRANTRPTSRTIAKPAARTPRQAPTQKPPATQLRPAASASNQSATPSSQATPARPAPEDSPLLKTLAAELAEVRDMVERLSLDRPPVAHLAPDPRLDSITSELAEVRSLIERLPAQATPAPLALADGDIAPLANELAEVRAQVAHMAGELAAERRVHGLPILHETRSHLLEQELDAGLVSPVIEEAAQAVSGRVNPRTVREAIARRLLEELPPAAPITLDPLPATLFLVGPGGAGKTTLAMRLAIEYATKRQLRVAIAGTDVDRAGAPQQLEAYAEAAGLAARTCYTPQDLQALLAAQTADVVIVDTVGHNGTDPERLAELGEFTSIVPGARVLLTLPATMKPADLRRLTTTFAPHRVDGLVLTRCDETASYGGLLMAAIRSKIGIAASTHGEASAEPARPGDNEALVAAIVHGSWPEPRNGARGGRAG